MAEDIKVDLDFKKRSELFHEEYNKLSTKHQIDLASILDYSRNGILPKIVLINLKKETKNG